MDGFLKSGRTSWVRAATTPGRVKQLLVSLRAGTNKTVGSYYYMEYVCLERACCAAFRPAREPYNLDIRGGVGGVPGLLRPELGAGVGVQALLVPGPGFSAHLSASGSVLVLRSWNEFGPP